MVERKFFNGNPEVMEWFRLRFGGFGNFARERKGNVSTVGTDVNVLGIDRAETHINHPFRSFFLILAFFAFVLLHFTFVLRLERERVVRVRAWAQSFLSVGETGCVIRT